MARDRRRTQSFTAATALTLLLSAGLLAKAGEVISHAAAVPASDTDSVVQVIDISQVGQIGHVSPTSEASPLVGAGPLAHRARQAALLMETAAICVGSA